MTEKLAFVAYPSQPVQLAEVIRSGVAIANERQNQLQYMSWEENEIVGRPIIQPILENIDNSVALVSDITKLNFNVTYEIGYAIGMSKKVILVKNTTIKADEDLTREVGVFDTLGYVGYGTSEQLGKILSENKEFNPIPLVESLDRRAPVYILETPRPIDSMRLMVSRVKKSRHQYRSYNASEDIRLSALDAIRHVGKSAGVLVPLLHDEFKDAAVHNMRAAFVAGLAHGMGCKTLIIQHAEGPVPLDIRDFAKSYYELNDIKELIQDFAFDVYGVLNDSGEIAPPPAGYLANLSIGDPMAENEFQTLGRYYLRTDEFARTRRGEVNVVVGRKGTGKTALFAQVRDDIRRNRNNIVVDLKPEGYQLVKLKENVLDFLSEGARAHLITAFWEYLLLSEVAYKVLEKDEERHIRDHRLTEPYQRLREIHETVPAAGEGDFSERLLNLSSQLGDNFGKDFGRKDHQRLTSDEVNNLLHLQQLGALRSALVTYLLLKEEIWVLFDNLDKGWSSFGVGEDDVVILRCLLDANRKIQRDLRRSGLAFYSAVFIRNDVYQLLVHRSADFGKELQAALDWSDADLLREMLRRRVAPSNGERELELGQIWPRICTPLYDGEETTQYFIDRCLMRPRNLLKIFSFCRGFAVNLGHDKIGEDDIEKGIKAYSNDLLLEADRELTDIEPDAEGLIYQFIGESASYTPDELKRFLKLNNIDEEKYERIIDYLLYYGFFGIRDGSGDHRYIYNVSYNMKVINTMIRKGGNVIRYVLNPAFWPALGIEER